MARSETISPVYYGKSYQAVPEAGGEKAFELMRAALMAIIPREDGMLIQTMFFVDEVKALPKSYTKPDVSEQELNMAKTLISSMDVPFDAAAYHDEYQQKLRAMIEAKIQGREVAAAAPEPNNVINLMDALKASIEKQQRQQADVRTDSPVYAGVR